MLPKPDPVLAVVLRTLREECGLTREAVAYKAGITTGALARIELGRSAPAWSTVLKVTRTLDVPLVALARKVEGSDAS